MPHPRPLSPAAFTPSLSCLIHISLQLMCVIAILLRARAVGKEASTPRGDSGWTPARALARARRSMFEAPESYPP